MCDLDLLTFKTMNAKWKLWINAYHLATTYDQKSIIKYEHLLKYKILNFRPWRIQFYLALLTKVSISSSEIYQFIVAPNLVKRSANLSFYVQNQTQKQLIVTKHQQIIRERSQQFFFYPEQCLGSDLHSHPNSLSF